MDFNLDQAPLGQQFQSNPLQYMQNFVRNMNNQLFLSQFHINHLYALLLIGRSSPWDSLKPSSIMLKKDVDQIVQKKVKDVKFVLNNLSQIYQDKMKKGTLNQIQRLMNIIKAQTKSIYINKTNINLNNCHLHHIHSQNQEKGQNKGQNQNKQDNEIQVNSKNSQQQKVVKHIQSNELPQINNQQTKQLQNSSQLIKVNSQKPQQQHNQHNNNHSENQPKVIEAQPNQYYEPEQQVFGLFYGIANIGNISAMAMNAGKYLQYNPVQKFIKFKMGKNYEITIKNEDPSYYDRVSLLKDIPSDMMINHIFPFLTSTELFQVRSVSKQWMDNVKQAWHATFKRQMFNQLLACQFCKDIQFFYKLIQLRNPFFQKLSLLLHALIQIIQWQTVYEAVNNNSVSLQLKRVLIVLLKLLGQPIQIRHVNQINDTIWDLHKDKVLNLKVKITQFFSNFSGNSDLSINDLRQIKLNLLDNPFMRVEQMQTEDKTPLLLSIFIKQLTLQQILKCHIFCSQQYLLNSKKRLDSISAKMPKQRGFLEGVYKILLLRNMQTVKEDAQDQKSQMPNFHELIQSIFNRQESDKPDFVIRGKKSLTNIFMDKATKLDIIVSTVRKINLTNQQAPQEKEASTQQTPSEFVKQRNSQISMKMACKNQFQISITGQENKSQPFQQEKNSSFSENEQQKNQKGLQTQKGLKIQSGIVMIQTQNPQKKKQQTKQQQK